MSALCIEACSSHLHMLQPIPHQPNTPRHVGLAEFDVALLLQRLDVAHHTIRRTDAGCRSNFANRRRSAIRFDVVFDDVEDLLLSFGQFCVRHVLSKSFGPESPSLRSLTRTVWQTVNWNGSNSTFVGLLEIADLFAWTLRANRVRPSSVVVSDRYGTSATRP